jgi:hypothetical protein
MRTDYKYTQGFLGIIIIIDSVGKARNGVAFCMMHHESESLEATRPLTISLFAFLANCESCRAHEVGKVMREGPVHCSTDARLELLWQILPEPR